MECRAAFYIFDVTKLYTIFVYTDSYVCGMNVRLINLTFLFALILLLMSKQYAIAQKAAFFPVGVTEVGAVDGSLKVISKTPNHISVRVASLKFDSSKALGRYVTEMLLEEDSDKRVYGIITNPADTGWLFVKANTLEDYLSKSGSYSVKSLEGGYEYFDAATPLDDETYVFALINGFHKLDLTKLPITLDPVFKKTIACGGRGATYASAVRDCFVKAQASCQGPTEGEDINLTNQGGTFTGTITFDCFK